MRVKATATVHGSPDSLIALADRIVSELILKENGDHGSVALLPGPTPSPPALRTYSRDGPDTGVRILRRGSVVQSGARPGSKLRVRGARAGDGAADRANTAEQHERGLAVAWQRKSDLSPSDRAALDRVCRAALS